MTSGYDRRSRFTKRDRFQGSRQNGYSWSGSVATVAEEVISFRDDCREATRVDERVFDPYLSGFHRSPGGISEYFDPGRRLLNDMREAGVLEESDRIASHSRGFIPDNGHPFSKVTHTLNTSASGAGYRWYNAGSDAITNYCSGSLPAISAMTLSTPGTENALFPLQGKSGDRMVARFDQGLAFGDLEDNLQDLGTIAISQCAPAVSEVSTLAIVGELARDVPMFPGHAFLRSLQGSSVGDEYLNLVFGLVPTLQDARNLSKVLHSYTLKLHQLRRDQGRPVRRKFGFPTSQRAEIFSDGGGEVLAGLTSAGCGSGYGFDLRRDGGAGYNSSMELPRIYANAALFMKEVQRTWFSGSFTYVLPEIPGFSGRVEGYMVEMDRLLGLSLNPSVAWQLSPWSWLVDWFIDIGTQMDVLTVNFDKNLVLNYGYAMQETERSIVARVDYKKDTEEHRKICTLSHLSTSLTSSYKRRIRANPYGFVLQTDGDFWSSYRLAVLGALGLSRL